MREIGLEGKVLCWFERYLTNRSQYVKINNITSNIREVNCGVPQGPLLSLIYINSIKDLGLQGNVYMYADDIALLYNSEYFEDLQIKITVI